MSMHTAAVVAAQTTENEPDLRLKLSLVITFATDMILADKLYHNHRVIPIRKYEREVLISPQELLCVVETKEAVSYFLRGIMRTTTSRSAVVIAMRMTINDVSCSGSFLNHVTTLSALTDGRNFYTLE